MKSSSPLFKVGIVTDTHIRHTPASCKKLKAALKLFASEKTDMIINCGDIADVHNPAAYKLYRQLINEIFPEQKPEEIFIHAYHDWSKPTEVDPSFKTMKETLLIPHEMLDKKVFKGYTFLIIPQNVTMENLEERIADAVAQTPDKPVFVIDHIPPYGIFHNGKLWGHKPRMEVLKKYPSVIHISGHIHASVFDESNIWQGEFSAVNAGGLASWGGDFAGAAPKGKPSGEALIMEQFTDRTVFRRISVVNSREYRPESPWTIPLPFDPGTAPYNADRRQQNSPAPSFSPRAKIKLHIEGKKFENLKIRFPEAAPDVFKYRLMISRKNPQGIFEVCALTEFPGNFYKAASYRKAPVEYLLSPAYFEKGKDYRISVIPENFYGKTGTPLCAEWRAPAPLIPQTIFETRDPMKELPLFSELEGGEPVKQLDGFYIPETLDSRLELPGFAENISEGTKLRLIADIRTIQENEKELPWIFQIRNNIGNLSTRRFTPYGDVVNRYMIDFPVNAGSGYYMQLRKNTGGKIRFEYLRIDIISFSEK